MPEDSNLCTIYIVRHGESESNAKGLLAGHLDSRLTEKGKMQAGELAEKLKRIHFDAVYSSDLIRAKQTAEIIVAERKLAVQASELIRERGFGVHEGRSREEYSRIMKSFYDELNKLSEEGRKQAKFPDGIESDDSIVARIVTFLREVAIANPNKTVLVVAHGAILRNFLIHIGFAKRNELPIVGFMENGAFMKIESDGIDFFIKETQGLHKIPSL